MSTRQKIVTRISIAAMLSIGLCAYLTHHDASTGYVALSNHAVEMKLIKIKVSHQAPSVNSISETDSQLNK
ncbi:MAG: hypothetical protein ACXU7D_11525 [Burkholderiaceae bacterium]